MTFVELIDNIPRADSITIAKGMNIEHRAMLQLIDKYQERFEKYGSLTFEMRKTKGRPFRQAWLNEKQSLFACTLMRNSEKVLDFKEELVDNFVDMRHVLINIKTQQQNASWIEERKSGKISRKEETDIIKEFIEYAIKNGSKSSHRYYGNYTRMQNSALFILTQKFKNVRDALDRQQLTVLNTCDQIVAKAIRDGMKEELYYKDIFQLAKKDVLKFVGIIGKSIVPTQKRIE